MDVRVVVVKTDRQKRLEEIYESLVTEPVRFG